MLNKIMKVRDLVEKLNKLDQDADIYGYIDYLLPSSSLRKDAPLCIDSVAMEYVEITKNREGEPVINLGSGSRKKALITMSSL